MRKLYIAVTNERTPDEPNGDEVDEFEDVVQALLEVDPKGLSGKHRKAEVENPAESDN